MLIRGEKLSTPSKGVKMLKYFCDMCKEGVKGYKYDLNISPIDTDSMWLVNKNLCKTCVLKFELIKEKE